LPLDSTVLHIARAEARMPTTQTLPPPTTTTRVQRRTLTTTSLKAIPNVVVLRNPRLSLEAMERPHR
jgi:hypothetical protein